MDLWVDKVVPSLLSIARDKTQAYREMLEMYLGWTEVFQRKDRICFFIPCAPARKGSSSFFTFPAKLSHQPQHHLAASLNLCHISNLKTTSVASVGSGALQEEVCH